MIPQTLPGSNSIFPGFYRQVSCSENVVYVTKVIDGLVSVQGQKGSLKGSLMSCQEFMREFQRIPERIEQ